LHEFLYPFSQGQRRTAIEHRLPDTIGEAT
jgi:hypothetical protein